MTGYWFRKRAFITLVVCAIVALVASCLFVYPHIIQQADYYNSQSIYKNTEIDFIAPEPSFEQVNNLPGTNGIDKVFPFFMTKTEVNVNGTSRTTTILLSDKIQDIDFTMYNQARIIEKSNVEYENPILVDWQFAHDTSAHIGDTVSFTIGGNIVEYNIYAVYETNSVYDGGAIIVAISEEQKESITQQSSNNGYSGMYISASNYEICRTYLTTDYRPLGRLRGRELFSDDDQYQVHYDAIMLSGYANEITDFRIRENNYDDSGFLRVVLGALVSSVIVISFNAIMFGIGYERVYFTKHCIPKGRNVKSYYTTAFLFETILFIVLYAGFLVVRIGMSDEFIPKSAIGVEIAIIPVTILVAEIISLGINRSMLFKITRKIEKEKQKKKQGTKEDN